MKLKKEYLIAIVSLILLSFTLGFYLGKNFEKPTRELSWITIEKSGE